MSRDQRKYKEQDKQKRHSQKSAKKKGKPVGEMTTEELMQEAMRGGAVMVQLPADSPLIEIIEGGTDERTG